MYYLLVAQCGFCLRVPIDHLYPTVNEALIVQLDEHPYYSGIVIIIHGKVSTAPVERAAKLFQLFQDDAAILFFPFPCIFKELVAWHFLFVNAHIAQHSHHLCLSGNRCMVGAGDPAGIVAFHFCTAYEYILYAVVQCMTHVQHARYIRRRHYNSVGRTVVRLTGKIS